jgi:hypothetical protein
MFYSGIDLDGKTVNLPIKVDPATNRIYAVEGQIEKLAQLMGVKTSQMNSGVPVATFPSSVMQALIKLNPNLAYTGYQAPPNPTQAEMDALFGKYVPRRTDTTITDAVVKTPTASPRATTDFRNIARAGGYDEYFNL